MNWTLEVSREQSSLTSEPYDRWVAPNGVCMAEFYRDGLGFIIRFPSQADFHLHREGDDYRIVGWPTPECDHQTLTNLFYNAIEPIIGNHHGGLFLHGSAVLVPSGQSGSSDKGVIAFLGLSRGGKTTLAGSFAREGYPFLTEDVIDLKLSEGRYWLQPKRSKLRLFSDSARYLLGEHTHIEDDDLKQDLEAGEALPFAKEQAPLRQIYLLGKDHRAPLSVSKLTQQEALGALLPHAFILDVADKDRLKSHFTRMAGLSQDIPCYALDFTRDYAELPLVRGAILESFASLSR